MRFVELVLEKVQGTIRIATPRSCGHADNGHHIRHSNPKGEHTRKKPQRCEKSWNGGGHQDNVLGSNVRAPGCGDGLRDSEHAVGAGVVVVLCSRWGKVASGLAREGGIFCDGLGKIDGGIELASSLGWIVWCRAMRAVSPE